MKYLRHRRCQQTMATATAAATALVSATTTITNYHPHRHPGHGRRRRFVFPCSRSGRRRAESDWRRESRPGRCASSCFLFVLYNLPNLIAVSKSYATDDDGPCLRTSIL